MNWLSRFFPAQPRLTPAQAQRLAAWQALPAADLHLAHAQSRYVVVDVETSGLNLAKDHLIAIGAVAVRAGKIDLADSLEIVLQQKQASSRDNILIHGIGGTAQEEGVQPVEALLLFLAYLGKSPLIAFHVEFDETMIRRALKRKIGLDFKHPWVDLAYIAPALHPDLARRYRALDDWTNYFGIRNYARHNALADALSTAQLFLALRERMAKKTIESYKELQDLDKAQRWVNRIG
ncbi:MAG: 3'-5' exonuclease [Sulfuricella sp.]|nr:3'-5' exonuclease [Gammaproteobacteria bacterium]